MKKMDYKNVRGTQDYLPEQECIRRNIRRTLEDTFIAYGCKPLETPILNYTSLMASKYAGGAEILQEMYLLSDRGERDLSLRYDLTIPFAKVIAMNPTLSMPFKRYEIGKVFRDGPIKAGRFREFTQCDVDIVGVDSQAAEAELMMMALDAFEKLEQDVVIQYNNRKLLVGLLGIFEVDADFQSRVILILDKIAKVGNNAVLAELEEIGLEKSAIKSIEHFLQDNRKNTLAYFVQYEEPLIQEGLAEVLELERYLDMLGITESCQFNPLLARGLEIYTGTIYEIFVRDGRIKSSIGSGGRYDNAIGGLLGGTERFATVGISFGLDVIFTAMMLGKQKNPQAPIDIYIIPINTIAESLVLAKALRKEHRVEVELSGKKIRKAMDKANRENIPFVIVLGEEEVTQGQYILKNMHTGDSSIKKFVF
ncbi:histidine--tRNA ligase [Lysinibacillus pakistanensis]|uniref:Histidine--tRNA ligase n=2 Tax=Lysinibacillus pakistanensis TaxID=759811 RepID=A0AAX3WZS2_9BACI|nr:histidine--tRNA ligase [Lysinibacillus pakistanensis]MDM5232932.1 histidine--tRNA ligase [Lysinibacillus pakistanensis]WHY48425.1 histidine--tRNA ligase [Lysinibacillus pakistanensis]WHY53438.1 histidine--tRNA ligase [Lysinibacillus pakistanensis]